MTPPTKAAQLQEQIDTLRTTVEQQQRQRQIDALLARIAVLETIKPPKVVKAKPA